MSVRECVCERLYVCVCVSVCVCVKWRQQRSYRALLLREKHLLLKDKNRDGELLVILFP
jgi:hypothetical protein